METNDSEPQRAHSPDPDLAQDIRDSFQAVLDALDAARADLYAFDEHLGRPEPSPSWQQPSEPARYAGVTHPPPYPPLPSAPSPPRRTRPVGPGPDRPDTDPSHAVEPYVVQPLRTGGVLQGEAPGDVVVAPLWLRDSQLEPGPPSPWRTPPPVGQPPMVSGAEPAYAASPPAFPPPPEGERGRTGPRPYSSWPATAGRPVRPSDRGPSPETPPPPSATRAHARNRSRGWRRFTGQRDTRVAGVFGLGAASGLILASSLLVGDDPGPAAPSAPSERQDRPPVPDNPAPSLPEIPGTGVLRQGDSGHGVYELQVRLLQVPNVYDRGATDGRYGKELLAAVARFQQWYGIRGDETGVYGDNTRLALMMRTK